MFNIKDLKDLKKYFKRLGITGLDVEEVQNVSKVIIYLNDGSMIEIASPIVAQVKMGNMIIYQVQTQQSNVVTRRTTQQVLTTQIVPTYVKPSILIQQPQPKIETREEKPLFTDEDIQIVIEQTGCSRDEAIKALKEAKGDIAKAILLITEKKK